MAREGRLSGTEKAAILLMNIGQELAGEVFKYMTPDEMQLLGGTIVRKESIPLQVGRQIVGEFMESVESGEVSVQGLDFAKQLVIKALGSEKAQPVLEQITRQMAKGSIESLKWMDPAMLANILRSEHPQIIALVLVHLDPERAGQVLLYLPEERLRGEVMLRVATLKRIPQAAVKELEILLKEQLTNADNTFGSTVEGVKAAAEILNQIESKSGEVIMEVIEKSSPDLAQKIQDKMFVFVDLLDIDDRGMQMIIKELSTDVLTLALKGTDENIKDKFLKNMSERAAEMLREDLESRGPVKLSEVEKAQQEIIKIARRLEQEGKVVRAGKGGDVLI